MLVRIAVSLLIMAIVAVAVMQLATLRARAGDADSPLETRVLSACSGEQNLGLVTAGLGTDSLEGGSFDVAGIPAGAEVVEAWLYWNGDDDGNDVVDDPDEFIPGIHNGDPTIQLNGVQVPDPHRVGGPAFWGSDRYGFGYRSDVTSIVTGNGAYTASGMDGFSDPVSGFNNGMELVVVYRLASRPATYVAIADGLDMADGRALPVSGPGTRSVFFQFEPDKKKRLAHVGIFLGGAGVKGSVSLWYETGADMPEDPQFYSLINNPNATEIANPFTGVDNQNTHGYWDDYSTSLLIPAGARWLAVQVESKQDDRAQIEWMGATVEMPLVCVNKVFAPLWLQKTHP